MRTAIVSENIVTNIAAGQVANGVPLQPDEWCAIGAAFDPNGSPRFTPRPVQRVWSSLEFLNRFTDSEMMAIENGRLSDPYVQAFYRSALAAQEIVSDDPRTIAGMDYIMSIGVIDETRKEEILNA